MGLFTFALSQSMASSRRASASRAAAKRRAATDQRTAERKRQMSQQCQYDGCGMLVKQVVTLPASGSTRVCGRHANALRKMYAGTRTTVL